MFDVLERGLADLGWLGGVSRRWRRGEAPLVDNYLNGLRMAEVTRRAR